MDLSAPEGERGEPYYFCPTGRPHGRGQSKAQRLCASPGKLQLLISSCPDQSCVKLCGGEKSGASLCYSLVCCFSPAPFSLSDHNHNYFRFPAVFFLKLSQLPCVSMLTTGSVLGQRSRLNPVVFMVMCTPSQTCSEVFTWGGGKLPVGAPGRTRTMYRKDHISQKATNREIANVS